MSEEMRIQHLKEMEERIMTKIDEVRAEVIEEMETNHMEIGVYKKEIRRKSKAARRSRRATAVNNLR